MEKLTDYEIANIVDILNEGKVLPESFKSRLFSAKKEYELVYAGKEREEDILADTYAIPLQKVKTFRNGVEGADWKNMLIFGDNLQVLKTLLKMKQEGKLKNADGTPGVRLVYIDPPFATKQEFRGSQDQKAYQDKIAGALFLEFLRKRLIFLRELLSEDGSIYIHLDQKRGHYVKVLSDEIFGEPKFQNEIIWKKTTAPKKQASTFAYIHDTIFLYSKNTNPLYIPKYVPFREDYITTTYKYIEEKTGRKYGSFDLTQQGEGTPRCFGDKVLNPPPGKHWIWSQEKIDEALKEGLIIFTGKGTPRVKKYLDEREGEPVKDIWVDILAIQAGSKEDNGYPTQKPETLIERIIKASSNQGDLVLDCFAGSGTTLAAAEKFDRRWIGVDCGKLAVYTMQKRLLNIADSKDLQDTKKKYGKQCRPFTLYNAGLYDYKMVKELPWEQYRDFALKLFQCRDELHTISGIELDGYMGSDSVMIFNYQKHKNALITREFIDDLHKYLADRIGRRLYLIAPAASVGFLEDYIQRDRVTYYIFRVPYSIIDEIHKKGFTNIKQPISESDVNDTVDAVGFDFIHPPAVNCRYYLDKTRDKNLFDAKSKDCVIKVERFESKIISRKPLEFANLETLSMIMLDYDFDGEVFDLDEVFYAEELKKNDYEARFAGNKVKERMMIIYIDIFGNEKRETKTIADFIDDKEE